MTAANECQTLSTSSRECGGFLYFFHTLGSDIEGGRRVECASPCCMGMICRCSKSYAVLKLVELGGES